MAERLVEDRWGEEVCGENNSLRVALISPARWNSLPCSWMAIRSWPFLPERLSFEPETCKVARFVRLLTRPPEQLLKIPGEVVLRNSWSLIRQLGKRQCDDFNLIWPADGSRQFGEEGETARTGRSEASASVSARRGQSPGWLIELLAVFELKGSRQTKPQAVQPHSLEIMGEGGGGPRESLYCVSKESSFYFFLIMQTTKKRGHYLRDCKLEVLRVSNFEKKELDSQVMGPIVASSI